ncbi:MAG: 8-amino-7-oxononanoate synthase [Myxococcota bacterium]|nr:8-amino-7-oxononanoate synthase [Myxococcota bacterium]
MSLTQKQYLQKLHTALEKRREDLLFRELVSSPGIDFASNDYLGLSQSTELATKIISHIQSHGLGAGASRLLNGHHELHAKTEHHLACFCERQDSLLFSSGFALNTGILAAIIPDNAVVFSDELNHASLIDGLRLTKAKRCIFNHHDFSHLEMLLESHANFDTKFIVTESLFSMDGDLTDLETLCDIATHHNAMVIIDEAHATGIYGPNGSGRIEELGLQEKVLCSMHTGGKALGVSGAWLACNKTLKQHLVNHCRSFIYSTATPVPVTAGLLEATQIVKEKTELRTQLKANIKDLSSRINTWLPQQTPTQILPLVVGEADKSLKLAEYLQNAQLAVKAVRPPTVANMTSRLRLTVKATHTKSQIEKLSRLIHNFLGEPQ